MIETPPETISVAFIFALRIGAVGDLIRRSPELRRWLYLLLGLLFIAIGVVGAILPVLPTTPWVLLAAGCFAKSSPRLHRWLKGSPYFGHMIRDWEMHRGIRWRVKLLAVGMIVTVIGLTVIFGPAPDWAKLSAVGLGAVGIAVVLFVVRTVWDVQLTAKSADGEVVPRE